MYGKIGVVSYDDQGKVICHKCGRSFNKLITHVIQKHNMTSREYKKKYGLDMIKGVMSKKSTMLARRNVYLNYDQCVQKNLLKKGSNTRFIDGSMGRPKSLVSEQTRLRLSHGRQLTEGE